jgi:ribose-phosphate pyrophosphokinase
MISIKGEPINVTMFPDKTSQVWKLPKDVTKMWHALVEWRFENEGEFMHLAQLKDLLDELGVKAYLSLPYLPYGRQDKSIGNEATFALRTFAKLLNNLNFVTVTIMDPHSRLALALIENSSAVYPENKVVEAIKECRSDLICYPDKGALDKYAKMYPFVRFIYGEKQRDPLTGNILKYELTGGCTGKSVMLIDDLVDGGMTFILLAKELRAKGATRVDLFATHGIFSKGTQALFDAGISRIFTKDGEVKQFKINDLVSVSTKI